MGTGGFLGGPLPAPFGGYDLELVLPAASEEDGVREECRPRPPLPGVLLFRPLIECFLLTHEIEKLDCCT